MEPRSQVRRPVSSVEPVPSSSYSEAYFDSSCGGHEFFSAYGPRIPKPQIAYALKSAGLLPGMRVLDIGCGRGELLYQARQAGAFAVGTDFSPAAVRRAGEVSGSPTLLCDAKELPFADSSFDRVFLIGVVDHLHEWELKRCFAELRRVLKPGGEVLIHTCANKAYFKNWTYALRDRLARSARAQGLPVPRPSPPRSGEDEVLHVNEHSPSGLRRFFAGIGWEASVDPRPNYRLLLHQLYGDPLPAGFPLKPSPRWRAWVVLKLLFRGPLKAVLARELFAVARPRDF